jgi:hypothetical protein
MLLKYASCMARHPQSDPSAAQLSELLSDKHSSLGAVLNRARLLLQLQQLLAGSMEPSLASHFQVANIRQNRLILLAPSASWATRLRMSTAELLETLHQAGFTELRKIDIRVAPLIKSEAALPAEKPLSAAARQALALMSRLGAKGGD